MTAEEEYKFVCEQYISDRNEIRKDITTFAIAIIAAVWVLLEAEIIKDPLWAKMTFLSAIAAIAFNVVGKYFRINHWMKCMDDDSVNIDYRSTRYGKLGHYSIYLSSLSIGLALIFFLFIVVG
ncbi:MAG: hypothetical protein P9M14_16485 [Candidatus Alcyoniella australis]|nr:hypothetical protein [Candidatus Alcyoniella australis]